MLPNAFPCFRESTIGTCRGVSTVKLVECVPVGRVGRSERAAHRSERLDGLWRPNSRKRQASKQP
eukprot:5750348-Prymnesium_polylepis.1